MNHITTSIRVELLNVGPEADASLHQRLMCPQQAASRFAYNRLREGMENKVIWRVMREKFPTLTGRNLNDAMRMAEGILASQREVLPGQADSMKRNVEATEKKLERELNRADGSRPERVQMLQRRLRRLSARRDKLQARIANGTVPPAVFGGRRLLRRVSRGLTGARDEWREKRADQFFSRGASNYKGNPHCRLVLNNSGALQISARVPDGIMQRGKRSTTVGRWLTFDVAYSHQYEPMLRAAASDGMKGAGSYDVRLMRRSSGHYRAYVVVDEPVAHREYSVRETIPDWCSMLGGVDLNLDHLAVTVIDRYGQFRKWKVFDYPNLGELPKPNSEWHIGNIAHDVMQFLLEHHVNVLVIEDLNIRRKEAYSKFNRRTVPFAYSQLTQALVRRALREGLVVKRVNPAYTSWIGQLKYAPQYGVSVHVAASYVIARRGLDLDERILKHLIRLFPQLAELVQADVERHQQKLADDDGQERDQLIKQLSTRLTWLKRLQDWKSYSPEAGKPWMLWVTLYLVSKNISGAREALGW